MILLNFSMQMAKRKDKKVYYQKAGVKSGDPLYKRIEGFDSKLFESKNLKGHRKYKS